jgi:hypothetical protein
MFPPPFSPPRAVREKGRGEVTICSYHGVGVVIITFLDTERCPLQGLKERRYWRTIEGERIWTGWKLRSPSSAAEHRCGRMHEAPNPPRGWLSSLTGGRRPGGELVCLRYFHLRSSVCMSLPWDWSVHRVFFLLWPEVLPSTNRGNGSLLLRGQRTKSGAFSDARERLRKDDQDWWGPRKKEKPFGRLDISSYTYCLLTWTPGGGAPSGR